MAHHTSKDKNSDSGKVDDTTDFHKHEAALGGPRRGGIGETKPTEPVQDNLPPPPHSPGGRGAQRFEDKTVLPGLRKGHKEADQSAPKSAPKNDEQTRRFGLERSTAGSAPAPADAPRADRTLPKSAEASEIDAPPVAGWLVIVGGPGKGRALEIVPGRNAIGRGVANDISLDFGDSQISRDKHAVVSYDPRGRRFYIQHGEGMNLTYLDNQPVLSPCELKALNHITLGDTVLRFVPLCGSDFDWQDTQTDTEEA